MLRLPVLHAGRSIRPASKLALCYTRRCNSTDAAADLGARLQADLKAALKGKNSFAATTIRSVLSEVYAAQKLSAPAALKQSDVVSIIRKAELRRLESVKQFEAASRPELAQQEQKEADLLATYLPSRLAIDEVDKILRQIIAEIPEKDNHKKAKGLSLKAFYAQVDKNTVDGDTVRQRIDLLWSS